MKHLKLAFIGGGNMATNLIGGLIFDGYEANKIWVSDPQLSILENLQKRFNIHTSQDNNAVAQVADVIILAVKPQYLQQAISSFAATVQIKQPLIISIAAGVREETLQSWLQGKQAIVRCMPNLAAIAHSAATGLYANSLASEGQRSIAESILRAVGITVWLDKEDELDTVTALSGSGPAYFFYVMEALEQAALQLGMDKNTARLLIVQTALGAARVAMENKLDLKELRSQVTSPGGTTECALNYLEKSGIQKHFIEAVKAAHARAIELAQ